MISLCPPYCGSFELDPLAVPTLVCNDEQECVQQYSTDCIIYHGTYFNCFGIEDGATLTEIITTLSGLVFPECLTTTTTTTTQAPTTTTSTTESPFNCDCRTYFIVNNTGGPLTIPFVDCLALLPQTIELANGSNITTCACLDSIPDFGTGFTLTDLGICQSS